jgi:hypothetical protein
MSHALPRLTHLARSKMTAVFGRGAKEDSRGLHRWVPLKNSLVASSEPPAPDAAGPAPPPASDYGGRRGGHVPLPVPRRCQAPPARRARARARHAARAPPRAPPRVRCARAARLRAHGLAQAPKLATATLLPPSPDRGVRRSRLAASQSQCRSPPRSRSWTRTRTWVHQPAPAACRRRRVPAPAARSRAVRVQARRDARHPVSLRHGELL